MERWGQANSGQTVEDIAVVAPSDTSLPGVAEYSLRTVRRLRRSARVHLVSERPPSPSLRQEIATWTTESAPCKELPTIAVLGNHPQNLMALRVVNEGLADVVILHDASLLNLMAAASPSVEELVETVAAGPPGQPDCDDLRAWLTHPHSVPFPILPRSLTTVDRVVVHSTAQRDVLQRMDIECCDLPVAMEGRFETRQKLNLNLSLLRESLGMPDTELHLVSAGYVQPAKLPEVLINAVAMLNDWGITTSLTFLGTVNNPSYREQMMRALKDLDLVELVRIDERISDRRMGLMFAAADAAIQLRRPFFGQLSGAMADALEARTPVLASDELIGAIPDLPEMVASLPSVTSSLHVAESVRDLRGRFDEMRDRAGEWTKFMERHSFESYAGSLINLVENQERVQ
jgi:hypothetical protein